MSDRSRWVLRHDGRRVLQDHLCVSSDLGLRKPEPAAYRRVAELVGLPPSKILFLDDGEVNVVGARDAGMAAAHVKSVSDIREALMAVGVSV